MDVKKGKVIPLQARCGPEGGYLYSSMTVAVEGGEWSEGLPGRTLPAGKTRYPDWPQGQSGRVENLVPTGIRSRTVQSVASRYVFWWCRIRISAKTQTALWFYFAFPQ